MREGGPEVRVTPGGQRWNPEEQGPELADDRARLWLGEDNYVDVVRESSEFRGGCSGDPAYVRSMAAGPVLGAQWTLRGGIVLHGSCVALGRRAVSFVGPQGRGKSTIAAQLVLRGHRFLSDGMTLLEDGPEGLVAHPGPRWFKLDDPSLRALGQTPEQLEYVHAGVDKRLWELGRASAEPTPLSHVYVLEEGELSVERMTGAAALSACLENMYLLPFLGGRVEPLLFRQAARVARSVPVVRLRRPRGFEFAPQVLAFLEADVARRCAEAAK